MDPGVEFVLVRVVVVVLMIELATLHTLHQLALVRDPEDTPPTARAFEVVFDDAVQFEGFLPDHVLALKSTSDQ